MQLRSPILTQPSSADLDPELEILLGGGTGSRLVCRACRSPVTADVYRIDVEGRHVHRRINPAKIDFEFGCFERAPGAVVAGEATGEHSWFSGYVWSFSICRVCGSHLGWFFMGPTPAFHALILARLEQEES